MSQQDKEPRNQVPRKFLISREVLYFFVYILLNLGEFDEHDLALEPGAVNETKSWPKMARPVPDVHFQMFFVS